LHTHSSEDPEDSEIKYSGKQLVDAVKSHGYDILALTLHGKVHENEELKKYAKSKGIILISGCEARIEGKDILIYNISEHDRKMLRTIDDLKKWKEKNYDRNILIIAPHPYYILPAYKIALRSKLEENIELFDAIEHSMFYNKFINPNKKAIRIAKKYHKPLIGNGDIHLLEQLNHTYTLINSEKDADSVIAAIKKNRVKIVSKPLSIFKLIRIFFKMI
jgi:predicted metal-dependent phosphoesterase TrpH